VQVVTHFDQHNEQNSADSGKKDGQNLSGGDLPSLETITART